MSWPGMRHGWGGVVRWVRCDRVSVPNPLSVGVRMPPVWYVTFFFEAGDAQSINCSEASARTAVSDWEDAIAKQYEECKTILRVDGWDDTPMRNPMQLSLIAEQVRFVQFGKY